MKSAENKLAALGDVQDPAEAARLMNACRSLEADARKAARDQTALETARTAEKSRLAALKDWNGTPDELLTALFPEASAVSDAKSAIERARTIEIAERGKLEQLEEQVAAAIHPIYR